VINRLARFHDELGCPLRCVTGLLVVFSCGLIGSDLQVFGKDESNSKEVVKGTDEPVPLALSQEAIRSRYLRFETTLEQLSEYLRKSDPQRAELLVRAIGKSKESRIAEHLQMLSDLLGKDQLGDAIESEEEVIKQMQGLLELLMSEDRKDEIEEEKARIRDLLKNLDLLIDKQTDVRAATERGGESNQLQKNQQQVTDATKKLVDKITAQDKEKAANRAKKQNDSQHKDRSGDQSSDPDQSEQDPSNSKDENSDNPDSDKPDDDPSKSKETKPADGSKSSQSKDSKSKDSKENDNKEGNDNKDNSDQKDEDKQQKDENKSDQKKSSQSPSQKSQKGKQQKGSQQQSDENSDPNEQQNEQENSSNESQDEQQDESERENGQKKDKTAGRENVERARKEMEQAIEELEKKRSGAASDKQDKAIAQLMKAKERLEEILRQLREEEREMALTALEARFRDMLLKQEVVNNQTTGLAAVPADQRTDRHRSRSIELARSEDDIAILAVKAMALLKEDGSSTAFPEAVDQIRDDMLTVAHRLDRADVGELTQSFEQDIVEALREILDSLQMEMEKLKDKKSKQQQSQQPDQNKPKPMVDNSRCFVRFNIESTGARNSWVEWSMASSRSIPMLFVNSNSCPNVRPKFKKRLTISQQGRRNEIRSLRSEEWIVFFVHDDGSGKVRSEK